MKKLGLNSFRKNIKIILPKAINFVMLFFVVIKVIRLTRSHSL
ncbi:hypothetical protein KIS4809_1820 [Bacillus sp. ZZV12-4809]|nr:hypothetical protein KIS4809_1820 [Bacillus sp. ZZV12-4809]